MFNELTLDQLTERARLNALRGIATSKELRDEIKARQCPNCGGEKASRIAKYCGDCARSINCDDRW